MSKHSTTHRTLSRRLAALLAAMALLAALALPVYAEALDGATGTAQAEIGDTISDGTVTTENDSTTPEPEQSAEPEQPAPTETPEPTAEPTLTPEPTATATATPVPTVTPTDAKKNAAAKTNTEQDNLFDAGDDPDEEDTMLAGDSPDSDDANAPDTIANTSESTGFIPATTTIYFEDDGRYDSKYGGSGNCTIRFLAQNINAEVIKDMTLTEKENNGHKVFSVTLNSADYPAGGFYRLAFQYYVNNNVNNNKDWKEEIYAFGGRDTGTKVYWTAIDQLAGKKFVRTGNQLKDDGDNHYNLDLLYSPDQWKRVEYYYKGMPLYFKNASDTALEGVTAVFYKQDETSGTVETDRQIIGTVGANKFYAQKILIPNNQSRFVKFTWDGGESALYDFTTDYTEDSATGAQKLDLTTANCYVYNNGTADSWASAGADLLTAGKTIYFDATLSEYSYKGEGIERAAMPGDNGTLYCLLTGPDGAVTSKQMEQETAPDTPDAPVAPDTPAKRKLWSCEIPSDEKAYTAVQFSTTADPNDHAYNKTKKYSTAQIPPTLQNPCFFADDGDPSAYAGGSRDGYWGEKGAIRDAESGKGTTVVDIAIASKPFTQEAGTKYITSTLYDYYTDYELNGFNRDSYPDNSINSQRWYVTFEQFDRALSSAYEKNKNVKYPLYTGHFQPSISNWSCPFAGVAAGMNLYGWGDPNKETEKEKYNTFMAVNNSALDINGKNGDDYTRTFQGLVEDKTSTGDANGLPVLKGTTNLVDPHFNKEFLEGKNTFNTVLGKVYEDVAFPFTKGTVFANQNETGNKEAKAEYWYYDSSKSSLYLTQDKDNSKLFLESTKNEKGELITDSKSENRVYNNGTNDTYGFFPFNKSVGSGGASQYNYGFGAKLQFDFTLTDDGMVQVGDKPEDKVPIKFFFSGDDDVWVYIDGQLVLDVGGAHGKASGLLEFGKTDDGKANTVTPYVSSNKTGGETYTDGAGGKSVYFNGKEVKFEKKGTIHGKDGNPFTLDKGTTHTLTMFYMERGMWESNMAIAFNFPDHNELQVQKIVDDSKVNALFKGCFDNQRFFNFTIRNQATHYGTKDAKGDTVTTINLLQPGKSTPVQNFTTTATHAEPDTGGKNRFTIVNNPPADLKVTDDTTLLNWFAELEDLTPSPGSNKDKRYGILRLDGDQTIDITGMSYLSFDVYVDSGEGDAALSNMYLELLDSEGKQKGCLNQTFIGGKDLYGQVEMHNRQWITVKLSLGDVKAEKDFDEKHVKELRFGCNYPRSIYLRNIVFSSKAVPQTVTGFTTKQQDIADYGSAASGTLKPAVNAQYTSDAEKGTMVVDKNGGFVLKNKEMVTFKDQFRRGSYLSINEQVDKNLFDTHWTIYEDGMPVKSTKAGQKLTLKDNKSLSLENQTGTAPDDGRIEKVNAEGESAQKDNNHNAYDDKKPSTQNPNDNTIVFRSYANPDATDAEGETQLKVVFVNTVKSGSLTIVKQKAQDSDPLEETYHFKVRFTNVGGHALEDEAIEKEYTAKVDAPCVIKNIPVGTRFTIKEVTPTEDGSKLAYASVSGGGSGTMVLDNQTVRGSIVAGDAGDKNQAVATFTNTKQELLDITGEKVWKNADNSLMTEHPATIYVQLQRRCVGETSELSWTPVTYLNETYTRVEQKYEGMKFSFLGLPAKDYDDSGNQTPYEYRVVEGSVDNKGVFQAVDDEKTITIGEKVYSVTYKYTASKPDAANNSNAKQTVTITNTQQDPKFTLDITKKDAENGKTPLAGVEFTLEKLDESGTDVDNGFTAQIGVTNADGKPMLKGEDGKPTDASAFTGLEAGKYRLTETKAAENYNLLSAPIEVEFTKTGECWLNGSKIEVWTKEKPTDFTKNENGSYTLKLTVLNRKTPALPHTGADAPSLWLLIGLPLAVAGLLILVFRYNKKGGRTR